jgi:hypothetical protein
MTTGLGGTRESMAWLALVKRGQAGVPDADGTPDLAKLVQSCRIATASRCWLGDKAPWTPAGRPKRY